MGNLTWFLESPQDLARLGDWKKHAPLVSIILQDLLMRRALNIDLLLYSILQYDYNIVRTVNEG